MKKALTLLSALILTQSALAVEQDYNLEDFIEKKKNELVEQSEENALNMIKCDQNNSLDTFLFPNQDKWNCKFSSYTLNNIEQSGGLNVSHSRNYFYVNSVTIEGDNEPIKTTEKISISESLDVVYVNNNNNISINYKNNDILSLREVELTNKEKIYLPESTFIDFSASLSKSSFNMSAGQDTLLIFFWR